MDSRSPRLAAEFQTTLGFSQALLATQLSHCASLICCNFLSLRPNMPMHSAGEGMCCPISIGDVPQGHMHGHLEIPSTLALMDKIILAINLTKRFISHLIATPFINILLLNPFPGAIRVFVNGSAARLMGGLCRSKPIWALYSFIPFWV